MFETATSSDGTAIAFERSGTGPALLIIGGAFSTRQIPSPLLDVLTPHFTVVTVDRRGRGDSEEKTTPPPYEPQREVEDMRAVIDAVANDGDVYVYGHSSGGALALELAAARPPIAGIAVYEPPYTATRGDADDPGVRVAEAIAEGERELAAEIFLGVAGMPVAQTKESPWWPGMVALAPTLPYDFALTDAGVPADRLANIVAPTLVMAGGESPEWIRARAVEVASSIPGAVHHSIEGQQHGVDGDLLAAELTAFFRPA